MSARLPLPLAGRSRPFNSALLLLFIAAVAAFVDRPADVRADLDDACPDNRGLANFARDDRLIMTYFYYWYDPTSLDDPALALHPPVGQPFDWRDPNWHRQQLVDMAEVGVDVALAVYWADTDEWSTGGLDALVSAREALLSEDFRPPAIGLMFDTNLYARILPNRPALADLTSEVGMAAFADLIGDYFDQVPACHQARVDGRPLVFVWRADTEDDDKFAFDQRTLDGVQDLLDARMGVRPLLVYERTWIDHAAAAGTAVTPEAWYGWGAALKGPRFGDRTVAVGPGYDDRTLVERPGYVRDRDDGRAYARDLRAAVLSGRRWLLLETWNELWEGTAIGETAEYGRDTLLATRRYVELFHRLDAAPARDGWFDLGTGEGAYLRRLAEAWQELGQAVVLDGRPAARALYEEADGAAYFHFAVEPRLGIGAPQPVVIDVEYYDEGYGSFYLEYDSDDPEARDGGRYATAPPVLFEGTGRWRTARFHLPDASFRGRQYAGYGDFRIRAIADEGAPPHAFGRVTVTAEPGPRPLVVAPEPLTFQSVTESEPVELRWSAVDGAAGYVVDIGPLDVAAPVDHAFGLRERDRCAGAELEPGLAIRAVALEPRCRLAARSADGDELYRWRATAIDAYGRPIGGPSDWSYLILTS
ncbi:MAG: DUF5010 domain-containing protein [Chloroflexota bacterium]|nr:DUF5010 domain-containing protein [Chloroflexota bacterium]